MAEFRQRACGRLPSTCLASLTCPQRCFCRLGELSRARSATARSIGTGGASKLVSSSYAIFHGACVAVAPHGREHSEWSTHIAVDRVRMRVTAGLAILELRLYPNVFNLTELCDHKADLVARGIIPVRHQTGMVGERSVPPRSEHLPNARSAPGRRRVPSAADPRCQRHWHRLRRRPQDNAVMLPPGLGGGPPR